MCDSLYTDIDDILKTAAASLPAVIARCEDGRETGRLRPGRLRRKFLAADALHSYQYNTVLHATEVKNRSGR